MNINYLIMLPVTLFPFSKGKFYRYQCIQNVFGLVLPNKREVSTTLLGTQDTKSSDVPF